MRVIVEIHTYKTKHHLYSVQNNLSVKKLKFPARIKIQIEILNNWKRTKKK